MPTPSAKKAALRSSMTDQVFSPSTRWHASASGEEREPGAKKIRAQRAARGFDGFHETLRTQPAIGAFLESVNYPAGLKAGLELLGVPAGPPRRPIQPLSEEKKKQFAEILETAGVLKPATA